MNTSADAAEQVVRISLNGMEVAAKITGKAAVEVANMLYAVMKDQKKTKGKTRLENLISSGKPLSVFTLQSEDFACFQKEAKRYGVLYYAVRNQRSDSDGVVDIMVKLDDAARMNCIIERFKLTDTSQTAQVKTEIERSRTGKQKEDKEVVRPTKSAQEVEQEVQNKEMVQVEKNTANPKVAKTTKSRQSEPIFNPVVEGANDNVSKPSVRTELKLIKQELEKEPTGNAKEKVKDKQNLKTPTKHQQPKVKKKKAKEK